MFEVRIHGRGGQGVVTAAELLSAAAFAEGLHAQAFPSFGSERTGAPVVAFCRLSERAIRTREPVLAPDALVIVDPTLVRQVDVFAGVGPRGYVLINSSRELEALGLADLRARVLHTHLRTVAATGLAREHLGRPLPNAALLGAFAALTRVLSLDSVLIAIGQRFEGRVAAGNAGAARAAYRMLCPPTALLEAAHA